MKGFYMNYKTAEMKAETQTQNICIDLDFYDIDGIESILSIEKKLAKAYFYNDSESITLYEKELYETIKSHNEE